MAFIKFNDSETLVQASVIPMSDTIVRIETKAEPNLSGFVLYLDEEMNHPMSKDEYMGYTTLYCQETGAYELSNNGSVWEEVSYIPTVIFRTMEGILEGESEQHVTKYEDLVAPEVLLEEGYEFVKWQPEIPSKGEIKNNMEFYAVVEDYNVYFHSSGGGIIDGESKQLVEDYSELVIPSPVADNNYKFVGWMPEIPEEGEIDKSNTHFYAVFESNIPERLNLVEGEVTDLQIGLVENYDLAITTSEEVTDLQLGLVENYDVAMSTVEEVTDLQLAVVELYDMLLLQGTE